MRNVRGNVFRVFGAKRLFSFIQFYLLLLLKLPSLADDDVKLKNELFFFIVVLLIGGGRDVASVTRWLDYLLNIWAIYKNEHLTSSIKSGQSRCKFFS